MLIPTRVEFRDRCNQIDAFLSVLESVSTPRARILLEDGSTRSLSATEINTLKATVYLLLYNLVESTVRNLVKDIGDEISSQKRRFIHLTDPIKGAWITGEIAERRKSQEPMQRAIESMIRIASVKSTFDIHPELVVEKAWGNIGPAQIRDIATSLGFDGLPRTARIREGKLLDEVKRERNKLAHGEKSFVDSGQPLVMSRIAELRDEVFEYLDEILDNVEDFLRNSRYSTV
jgi:hypothetical protein